MAARAGERYTLRRQVFRFIGAGFHIYDGSGGLVGYGDQKGWKLREDLRVYTDESRSEELLRIGTEQIIDWGATYTVKVPPDPSRGEGDHPEGGEIGSFRRKGLKSMLRDEWIVCGPGGQEIASVREDSQFKAIVRRAHEFLAALTPQGYHLIGADGAEIATYRTHFNPFVHRLGVTVHREDGVIDDLMLLAGGVLLLAIEGRQD